MKPLVFSVNLFVYILLKSHYLNDLRYTSKKMHMHMVFRINTTEHFKDHENNNMNRSNAFHFHSTFSHSIKNAHLIRILIRFLQKNIIKERSLTDCDRGHFTCILVILDILLQHIYTDVQMLHKNTTTSSQDYNDRDL